MPVNLHRVGFCGLAESDDIRFKNSKAKKIRDAITLSSKLKNIKKNAVNMNRVKLPFLRSWITKKLTDLLGFEDEIVLDYLINQLEQKQYPDPKEVQINITGFINGKNAKEFVGELWPMLISATTNGTGIPQSILDAKKREIQSRHSNLPQDSQNSGYVNENMYNKLKNTRIFKSESTEVINISSTTKRSSFPLASNSKSKRSKLTPVLNKPIMILDSDSETEEKSTKSEIQENAKELLTSKVKIKVQSEGQNEVKIDDKTRIQGERVEFLERMDQKEIINVKPETRNHQGSSSGCIEIQDDDPSNSNPATSDLTEETDKSKVSNALDTLKEYEDKVDEKEVKLENKKSCNLEAVNTIEIEDDDELTVIENANEDNIDKTVLKPECSIVEADKADEESETGKAGNSGQSNQADKIDKTDKTDKTEQAEHTPALTKPQDTHQESHVLEKSIENDEIIIYGDNVDDIKEKANDDYAKFMKNVCAPKKGEENELQNEYDQGRNKSRRRSDHTSRDSYNSKRRKEKRRNSKSRSNSPKRSYNNSKSSLNRSYNYSKRQDRSSDKNNFRNRQYQEDDNPDLKDYGKDPSSKSSHHKSFDRHTDTEKKRKRRRKKDKNGEKHSKKDKKKSSKSSKNYETGSSDSSDSS